MATNAFRRMFGGEPDRSPPDTSDDAALTSAFLDADRRFSGIEEDARTLADQDPAALAVRQWPTIVDRYSTATEHYLWVTGSQPGPRPATAHDRLTCTRELTDLISVMDRFRADHEQALTRARGARAGAQQRERAARVAADRATDRLAAPDSVPYLNLRPVINATDRLVAAVHRLDAAVDATTGAAARDEAARAVEEAAQEVEAALEQAPHLGESARRAVASAGTRLQAVRNRAADLHGTRSALLREFSSACSADLVDNDRVAAREAEAADRALASADNRLREKAPALAHDQVALAREHLDAADTAVDAVTARLRLLREVKADPAAVAGRTRFALRDAQLLAVQKQQVGAWGSVIDAQHERIERAMTALDRVHPDYWEFLQTLADIDRTLDHAVNRMRGRT